MLRSPLRRSGRNLEKVSTVRGSVGLTVPITHADDITVKPTLPRTVLTLMLSTCVMAKIKPTLSQVVLTCFHSDYKLLKQSRCLGFF